MMIYYQDPETGLWQPERRKETHPPVEDLREADVSRTTSEQYTFLKDWLIRREELQGQVGKRARIIRHVLAVVALCYIALFFSQPDFTLTLSGLGIEQQITIVQIGAIAPLIIAYLVLHAAHLGLTRLKLIHECKVVEKELQRFGLNTSYRLLADWKRFCQSQQHLKSHFLAVGSQKAVYWIYDLFLTASVLVAFYVSGILAVRSYGSLYSTDPHSTVLFLGFLAIGALAAVVSIVALRYCRIHFDTFLGTYLSQDAATLVRLRREREHEEAPEETD